MSSRSCGVNWRDCGYKATRLVTVVRGVWRTSYASVSIWKSSISSDTNVRSDALPVLAAMLQSCRKLTTVCVDGDENDFSRASEQQQEQFVLAVRTSPSLRELDMPPRRNVTEYLQSQLAAIRDDPQHSLSTLNFWY